MSHSAINTLEYAKKFERYGFPQNQAEGLANALFEVMEEHGTDHAAKSDLANFATKSDIDELALATKNDIAALALTTKNDIQALAVEMHKMEHQILVKLGTLMVSLFAVFSAIPQLFG